MFKVNDHLYILCPITLDDEQNELTPEKVLEKTILPRYDTISVYSILNTEKNKYKYEEALVEIISSFHENDYLVEMIDRDSYLIKIYKLEEESSFVAAHIRIVKIMEVTPRLVV